MAFKSVALMSAIILMFGFQLRADIDGSLPWSGSQPTADSPDDPIIGTAEGANCIPFGCDADFGINTYQQVYSASAFSSVTPFNQINFFLGLPGYLDFGTYEIYFSYTTKSVDGLSSSSPSANIGADETLFGSYTLSGGSAPSTLTFNGNTFDYNPAMGNLLMTIETSGSADSNSGWAFYEIDDSAVTSREFFGINPVADGVGLVTGFNDVTPVPEPSVLLLVIPVLAFVGPKLRRGVL